MRQKKSRKGFSSERITVRVPQNPCVIWTVEGGVKFADVGLALVVGDMLVSRKEVFYT